MKNIYTISLLIVSLLFIGSLGSSAQEMIVGGDMENGDSWSTSTLNQDGDNTVTTEFGYTGDKPSAGVEGCLHLVGSNTGTDGGNLTNFMVYQQVTIQRGAEYNLDFAYKDIRTNNCKANKNRFA